MNVSEATDWHSATVQRGLCGLIDCRTVQKVPEEQKA